MRHPHRILALALVFCLVVVSGLMMGLFRAAQVVRSYTYAQNGYMLGQQERYAEAIKAERTAVLLDPGNGMAHNNLGFYLFRNGQLPEAERECREAVRLIPNNSNAHDSLGQTLAARGATEEAVAECREAVRLKPMKALYYNSLGRALYCAGQPAEARQAWQQALALNDPTESQEARKMLAQTGGN
jgi:Flp pilus assembly protein TadD